MIDTSCGDGAFLGRALERLLDLGRELSDDEPCARIEGWEIHAFAASQARCRIRRVLVEHGHEPARAEAVANRIIRCGDFLTEGPRSGQYQAVVGNPLTYAWLNMLQGVAANRKCSRRQSCNTKECANWVPLLIVPVFF